MSQGRHTGPLDPKESRQVFVAVSKTPEFQKLRATFRNFVANHSTIRQICGAVGKEVGTSAWELLVAGPDNVGYVNQHGLSRKHIVAGVKASLKRLQLDYIDVLQCAPFCTSRCALCLLTEIDRPSLRLRDSHS